MPETLFAELACIVEDVAEFTLFDADHEKQAYMRYPADDLPSDTEEGDVFTATLTADQEEIDTLERNPEKTEEFRQEREEVLDELL